MIFCTGENMGIFLDTGFLVAFYNSRDKYHKEALNLFKELKNNKYGKIYTSYFVLDETFTYLQKKMRTGFAYELAELWIVNKKGFAKILELNQDNQTKIAKIFVQQSNERKPLSYTDCSNVVLSQIHYIDNIATFDNEFNQYLTCIPKISL